jgi:branched-chain amino acid transport system permease protein
MSMFIQQVITGITVGCIYGLVALGYTMVYGVLRMINFAHAELFMLGPMAALSLLRATHVIVGRFSYATVPMTVLQLAGVLAMCFLGAGIFSAAVGVSVERIAYRPLRRAPALSVLITALGASLFLQNADMILGGRNIKPFPRLLPTSYFNIAGAALSNVQVFIVVLSVALLAGLLLLVNRTYLGRAIRAVAEDKDVAALMGVDVNRTISWVFVLGPALGAASGLLFSMYYSQAYYYMGSMVGTRAWTAAIIGGIGDLKGALVGGLLLGVLETIGAGYLPIISGGKIGSEYTSTFAFILLIIMLLVRPQGIFGEPVKG